jgi:hypothetical protein
LVSKLRVVVLIFPIVVGLLLLGSGIITYSGAQLHLVKERDIPYGLLVFSSMQLDHTVINIEVPDISLENDRTEDQLLISFEFELQNPISEKQNQIIGFQFPYAVEYGEHWSVIRGLEGNDYVDTGSEHKVQIVEEEAEYYDRPWHSATSLVYVNFQALPNVSHYSGQFGFSWKSFLVRREYSTYGIVFPFALNVQDAHQAIRERFPGAFIRLGTSNDKDRLTLTLSMGGSGGGLDLISAFPSPIQSLGRSHHITSLMWEIETRDAAPIAFARDGERASTNIAVYFESLRLAKTRDSMLFSGGTFLGLGAGLFFSGIYEVLRTLEESRRKYREKA